MMQADVAVLSYAAAGCAFLLLSILLLTRWRARTFSTGLSVASLISTAWAVAFCYAINSGDRVILLLDLFDIVRSAVWLALLMFFLGYWGWSKRGPSLKPLAAFVAVFFVLLFSVTSYLYYSQAGQQVEFVVTIVAKAVMALFGLVLVEQLYRNTPDKNRWGIKYICLGLGGFFAYDFYMYSDAMLFRQINVDIWTARGAVNALIVPLIAMSVARNPKWMSAVAVSHRMLFHSAALFGAAVYLLAMAAAGYLLRYFGGSWGLLLQAVFLFGAVVLLFVLVSSGTSRSWLKVFISKHFFSYRYDYREEWLRFTRRLTEDGQLLGERVIEAIAEMVESPSGVLWVRKGDIFEPTSSWNMKLPEVKQDTNHPLSMFMAERQWVIDCQEYETNPEKYESLQLPDWLSDIPRVWLIVPLVHQRSLFGFLLLTQSRSKINMNWEVIDLLGVAATQAASYLAQQQADQALLVAKQFDSFNRMSTFVVHDIKNLVAQLSLLLKNAEKHKNNPEFQQDMIETLDLSVNKMRRMLEKLSNKQITDKTAVVDLVLLLQRVVAAKILAEPKPSLVVVDGNLLVAANAGRLERILGHLIQNAIEATDKTGQVVVRLSKMSQSAWVEIHDTGCGMTAEFIRDKLFKPFESTKTAGMGIGVFESQEYVQELGGRLEVTSAPGLGTVFRVVLPISE